jgi:hypothetical protein
MDELLSIEAARARLGGISKWTLYAWLSHGRFGLQRVKIGSRTMVRASDLDKIPYIGGKSPAPRRKEWE